MRSLVLFAGIVALTFLVPALFAQSAGDAKKDETKQTDIKKEDKKVDAKQADSKPKTKPKPDWSGEFSGILTTLDEKDLSRLSFTVQVQLQSLELDNATQNRIAQLQLTLAQQQQRLAQAKTASAQQTALFSIQKTALQIEQAKAELYKLKTTKLNVKCKAADNMRVRHFAAQQLIDPDTGEFLKMSKGLLEEARGWEGYPGYKADVKVLQKGQAVRVYLSQDAVAPAALLNQDKKAKTKLDTNDINPKNTQYSVIMIVVLSDPLKGG